MIVVDLRIIAASEQELLAAIAELKRAHGDRVMLRAPRQGRRGDWVAYGTLIVAVVDTTPS